MKKVIFAASAVAALAMSSVASAGEIEFLGEITESTCDVSLEGGGTLVTLPTISKSLFNAIDDTAGRTSFALLASNCTLTNGKTRVAAFFNGNNPAGTNANNVDSVTGYLNNLAVDPGGSSATGYPTAAAGIKLRLIDGTNGNIIRAGYTEQVTNAGWVTTSGTAGSQTARLPYSVEYIATESSITAGPVRSVAIYDLQYN